jgi:hypothetical protein
MQKSVGILRSVVGENGTLVRSDGTHCHLRRPRSRRRGGGLLVLRAFAISPLLRPSGTPCALIFASRTQSCCIVVEFMYSERAQLGVADYGKLFAPNATMCMDDTREFRW